MEELNTNDDNNLAFERCRTNRDVDVSITAKFDFMEKYNTLKEGIHKKFANAKIIETVDISLFLDDIKNDINHLQSILNESSMFLAPFNIKKTQESINEMNEVFEKIVNELQPKKKFGFKKKTHKPASEIIKSQIDEISNSSFNSGKLSNSNANKLFNGFKYIDDKILEKSKNELKNRQLNLENLTRCKIIALGNPSSLQISNVNQSVVIVGPTSRSALIKDCTDCSFVLACQQVRIHNTVNSQFYLHVTGSAIIENCHSLSIGPYTLNYLSLDQDFRDSGLSKHINNWKNIEDFNWFNQNEQSPNFRFLDEDSYKTDWLSSN